MFFKFFIFCWLFSWAFILVKYEEKMRKEKNTGYIAWNEHVITSLSLVYKISSLSLSMNEFSFFCFLRHGRLNIWRWQLKVVTVFCKRGQGWDWEHNTANIIHLCTSQYQIYWKLAINGLYRTTITTSLAFSCSVYEKHF